MCADLDEMLKEDVIRMQRTYSSPEGEEVVGLYATTSVTGKKPTEPEVVLVVWFLGLATRPHTF
jgi:hypothetical protein